jgi:hypothetical protein
MPNMHFGRGLFTNLTISGEANGMWEVSADLLGAAVTTMAMTTGLITRCGPDPHGNTHIYVTPGHEARSRQRPWMRR